MRIQQSLAALALGAALLAACGAQPGEQQTAELLASPTATNYPNPTSAPSATPSPSATPEPSPTATTAPSATPEPTATEAPSATPAPTAIAAPTPSPVPESSALDTPQLTDQTAPPTPAPVRGPAQPAQPVRVQIPSISLDYHPVSVGLDPRGVPIVPKHDVAWYNLSAMPGQGENVVFWGHVLRFTATPQIPAPFARVHELKPGDRITLTTARGDQAQYAVTKAVQVTPDQVQYILPTGKEQVTLVSCIGDNVISNGSLTKQFRLITIAEPVR